MTKILVAFILCITLASCASSSLEETIGVTERDNAMQCIEGELSSPNPFVLGRVRTKRMELPANFDTSTLTLETVQELMKWCD